MALSTFDTWIWTLSAAKRDGLRLSGLRAAAHADRVDLPPLTVLTLIGDGSDPVAALEARVTSIREVRRAPNVTLLLVVHGGARYVIALWDAGDGVYHLVGTVPATDPAWKHVEESWINAVAPRLTQILLNRDDFEAIGDALEEHGDVETTRMTARVLHDQSSYTRGWPRVGVKRPTHREALEEARDMMVRSLTLDVAGSHLQVRRTSGASFYRGQYRLFTDVVLARLKTAACERRTLLADRERAPRSVARQVISMAVEQMDLSLPTSRRFLREAISDVKGLQVAAVHGNPYLHLLVTDYLTGTSFDVLVTEPGRVEIVPGIEASVGSLARVTDAIGGAVGMRQLDIRTRSHSLPDDKFLTA
jgi:hypothetical protein